MHASDQFFTPRSFPQAKSRRKQARKQTQVAQGSGAGMGSLFARVRSVKHILGATAGFARGRVGEQLAAVISSGDKGMPRRSQDHR